MKYSFIAFVLALGLVACSKDDEYEPGTTSGDQVFFHKDLATKIDLTFDNSTFTVPLNRYVKDQALTVAIQLTDTSEVFTAPTEVTFKAGEDVANIVITYDPTKLAYNDYKSASLTIVDQGTPYANNVYSFRAGVPLTYTSLGKGTFVDGFFGFQGEVTIEQCDQETSKYRIAKPFAKYDGDDYFTMDESKMDDYLELTILKKGDKLGDVEITEDNLVYFPVYSTGAIHPSYTDDVICMLHPTEYTSMSTDVSKWVHNYVAEYDADGNPSRIQLAPSYYMFKYGGWNYTQDDDVVNIYFPGNAPKDYTAEVIYNGIYTAADGLVYVVADVAYGSDIESVKGVVVAASEDVVAVAQKVAAGELEAYDLTSGSNNVPVPADLTGKLQLVLIAFAEDEIVNISTSVFEYYGGGATPWQSMGVGTLTDDFVSSMYTGEDGQPLGPLTYEVEVQQNTDEPGVYRLVNAFQYVAESLGCAYAPASLEINAADPEGVYFVTQSTGVDDGDGEIFIASYGGYMLSNYSFEELKQYGYFGSLVDGVITFPDFDSQDKTYTFQGVFMQGESGYYTGSNGGMKIVLPTASASARNAAAFSNRLASAARLAKASKVKGRVMSVQQLRKQSMKQLGKSCYLNPQRMVLK